MDPVPTSPKYKVKYPEKFKREMETEERHRTLFFAFLIAVIMGLVAGLTGYMIGRAYFPDTLPQDAIRDVRRPVTSPIALTDDVQKHVDFVIGTIVAPEAGEYGYNTDDVIANGVLVTNDGLMIVPGTFERGKTVRVLTGDGALTTGEIQAYDPFNDISIVQVDTKTAVPMSGADVDAFESGDRVFGVKRIPGAGLVWQSGFITHVGHQDTVLNTTTASPRLYATLEGENVLVFSQDGGFVGFAKQGQIVTIDGLEQSIRVYLNEETIKRYDLNISYISLEDAVGLTPQKSGGLDYGALITESSNPKLGVNDVIVEVNGVRISREYSPEELLNEASLEKKANVTVVRQNREVELSLDLTR